MKKLLSIAVISVVVLGFSSCKKNYTCTCTYTTPAGIDKINYGEFFGTKSQARKACQNNEANLSATNTDVNCQL